jgi:hypothetical protein
MPQRPCTCHRPTAMQYVLLGTEPHYSRALMLYPILLAAWARCTPRTQDPQGATQNSTK